MSDNKSHYGRRRPKDLNDLSMELRIKIFHLWHTDFVSIGNLSKRYDLSATMIKNILDERWAAGPGADADGEPRPNQSKIRSKIYS